MNKQPSLHDQYWGLSFRPLIKLDGTVGMVGVSTIGPAAVVPEMYPNLLMAAPALYAQLFTVTETLRVIANVNDKLHAQLTNDIEQCEKALTFALHGYMMPKVDTSQFGKN